MDTQDIFAGDMLDIRASDEHNGLGKLIHYNGSLI